MKFSFDLRLAALAALLAGSTALAAPVYTKFTVKDPQQSAGFLAVADFNGDGRQEIILSTLVEQTPPGPPTSASRGALRRFSTAGGLSGPWSEEVLIATTAAMGYPFINTPQVFDVDGDGVRDLVVHTGFLTTVGGAHFWLKGPDFANSPHNFFDLMKTRAETSGMYFWHESGQTDLDGDGRLDIVTTSAKTQSPQNPLGSPNGAEELKIEWYRNLGGGQFEYHLIQAGFGGVFIKLHDIDGDGDQDILVSEFFRHPTPTPQPAPPSLVWLENLSAPSAANNWQGVWQSHVVDNSIGLGYFMQFADLDGDGRDELIVDTHNNDGDPRWQNAQGQLITPPGLYSFSIPANPRTSSQWPRRVISQDFKVTLSYMSPGSQGVPGIFDIGDINYDGRPDIAVPGDGNDKLYAFIQRADGSFRQDIVDLGKTFGMALVTDIDGDGYQEIVAAKHNSADGGTTLPPGLLAIYQYNGPDELAFAPQTAVTARRLVSSEPQRLAGFRGALSLSVSGPAQPQFNVDGGAWGNTARMVYAGQTIRVRHLASAGSAVTDTTLLMLGQANASFVTTTADTTPDAYSFGRVIGAAPGSLVSSADISLAGYNGATPILPGPGAEYSLDGGNSWRSKAGELAPGQALRMRLTASNQHLYYAKAYLRIGGVTGYFTVRTR